MKRQRGRNRGGGSSGGGGGGKPQAQNANRAFDSNGPEGSKVRGNAQHVFEKYQQLARDASAAGDRVLGENYLQHAEHYFRLLRAMQPTRPASEILGRDHFSSGFDIDFEDEAAQAQSEAADAASAEAGDTAETWQARENGANGGANGDQQRPRDDSRPQQRDDRPRDGQRDDRPRDDRPRDGQQRDGQQRDDRPRYENRDRNDNGGGGGGGNGGGNGQGQGQGRRDRPWRDERPRDDQPRSDQPRNDQPRAERPRYDDRPRDDRPRDAQRDDRPRFDRNRDDRPERDPLAMVEPQAQAPLAKPAPERKARVLRDSDGGESHAPAFLQAPATRAVETASDAAPKPRRKRAPRAEITTASEGEDA